MKKSLAPNWVMIGLLALIILNAIPGIIMSLDLITPETVSFSEDRVWSGSYTYLKGGWIMYAISLVFYAAIAILSIVRKWSPAVLIGSILLIVNTGIVLWVEHSYISATGWEALANAFEKAKTLDPVNVVSYLAGSLLIAFCSAISKTTKVLFAILICLGFLLPFIPIPTDLLPIGKLWCSAVRPIFAAVLIYLCLTSKPTPQITQ